MEKKNKMFKNMLYRAERKQLFKKGFIYLKKSRLIKIDFLTNVNLNVTMNILELKERSSDGGIYSKVRITRSYDAIWCDIVSYHMVSTLSHV